jgi:electron transport complex protein RnfG
MAKLESSLKNMLLSLTCITLIAAGALAGIYTLTIDRINAQKAAAEQEARLSVLAGCEEGTPVMVETDGFGGKMKVMFGFAPDGTILGYKVLEHSETPGLGDKAVWWFQKQDKPGQNIVGRVANGTFSVSKDGGDVDAITAATISSRAFLKAANEAYNEFRSMDAATGATKPVATEDAEEEDDEVETNEETEAQDE